MLLALPASAMAQIVDYFPVTLDASWYMHNSEGYGDRGDGNHRIVKASNQNISYMDWAGSEGDLTGMSLSDFIVTGAGLQDATLYLRMANPLAGGKTARVLTLRSGNQGDMVEGDWSTSGTTWDSPDNDCGGGLNATQAVAWKCGTPTVPATGGYLFRGEFGLSTGGIPWITPSTRPAGWSNHGSATCCAFGPNAPIGCGFLGDSGRSDCDELWAVEIVLGFHWSQGGSTVARHEAAGQLVNDAYLSQAGCDVGGNEPRDKAGDGNAALDWHALAMDLDIVEDIANNPENKGIVFTTYGDAPVVATYGNEAVYASDQSGGIWGAYLAVTVPEPATLSLLALGGLAMLRRRK